MSTRGVLGGVQECSSPPPRKYKKVTLCLQGHGSKNLGCFRNTFLSILFILKLQLYKKLRGWDVGDDLEKTRKVLGRPVLF